MDRRPRAESVRLMAAAAHLPGIAVVALLWPRWRSVRLVRHHAFLSLGLQGLTLGLLFAGSLMSGLLSGLGLGLGLYLTMAVGLLNLLAMLGWTGLSAYAAYGAYQGERTALPLVGAWADGASRRSTKAPLAQANSAPPLAQAPGGSPPPVGFTPPPPPTEPTWPEAPTAPFLEASGPFGVAQGPEDEASYRPPRP